MILFFDKSVGTVIPQVLQWYKLKFPIRIEYHEHHFSSHELDDQWLPIVGQWGWTVIGHDSSYHLYTNELSAIKQYGMGCFYLWGSEAKRWQKLQCLARAYDRIVEAEASTPRPFIYRITETGLIKPVPIP